MMSRVFIRYESHYRPDVKQEVAGFIFDGKDRWVNVSSLPHGTSGELLCQKCGANNWTENGRSINEYECGCCGAFVTVEPIN